MYAGYGTLQCHNAGSCPGVPYGGECYPNHMWSAEPYDTDRHWVVITDSGVFNLTGACNVGHCVSTYAFSVRCVLDLKANCGQLCDDTAGYGTLQCGYGIDNCPGAGYIYCYPNFVWSAEPYGTNEHWAPGTAGGVFGLTYACYTGHCLSTYAFSVRCVLDLKANCGQLCDMYAGNGTLQCYWANGSCPGATFGTSDANYCYPYCLWSSSIVGDTSYYRGFCLHPQGFTTSGVCYISGGVGECVTTYAFSVRCVLDLDIHNKISSVTKIPKPYRQQLCDAWSGYGTLQCLNTGSCPGAAPGTINANNCYPFDLWSSKQSGETFLTGQLINGEFHHTNYNAYTLAFSVRCVLDLKTGTNSKYKITLLHA